jgi:hypothetical protein
MKPREIAVACGLAVSMCPVVSADDKWEFSLAYYHDDSTETPNQLLHGAIQTHDLQGASTTSAPTDLDFSVVASKIRHSYEVRVFSTQTCFKASDPRCAGVQRTASDGTTVLTTAIQPDGPLAPGGGGHLAVRWIASATQPDYIKVFGYQSGFGCDANNQYDIQMRDTTFLVPRWNNSATQTTVLIVQNGSAETVTGSIYFYDGSGTLLHTAALSVAANAVQVVATSSIPALAGQSGAAAIAHTGAYGSLAGKAAALEPATGFAFDTPISPIPY